MVKNMNRIQKDNKAMAYCACLNVCLTRISNVILLSDEYCYLMNRRKKYIDDIHSLGYEIKVNDEGRYQLYDKHGISFGDY